ncbi:MAG: hypothetical protein N4A54_10015 [Peptostreptococcaceae bacterium]|nr:hypothetical protein [Peptostreptococcaceae bacterium]
MKKKLCPSCKEEIMLMGEGGYGICKNDECDIFNVKLEYKDLISCEQEKLKEEDHEYSMED